MPSTLVGHVLEEAGGKEVGLADEVEDLVLAPRLVLEAAVARVLGDDRLHVLAHHAPRGVLPEGEVVLPEAELRLHQAGGVGHQPGRHFEKGGADVERVGIGGAGAFHRLAPEEVGHDPLAALRDLGHRPGDQRGVRQAELALGGQRRFLIHGSSLPRCAAHSNRRRTAAAPRAFTIRARAARGFRARAWRDEPVGGMDSSMVRAGRTKVGLRGRSASVLLACLAVGACGGEASGLNPAAIWREVSGANNAARPAPPGLDRPFPSLGSVPPRPERPSPEVRDAITAALTADRSRSREPVALAHGAGRERGGNGAGDGGRAAAAAGTRRGAPGALGGRAAAGAERGRRRRVPSAAPSTTAPVAGPVPRRAPASPRLRRAAPAAGGAAGDAGRGAGAPAAGPPRRAAPAAFARSAGAAASARRAAPLTARRFSSIGLPSIRRSKAADATPHRTPQPA